MAVVRQPGRLLTAGARLAAVALLLPGLVPILLAWFMAYPPYRPLSDDPGAHGMPFEAIQFPSPGDGVMLEGWYIPAQAGGTGRTVVLAHGYLNDRLIHGRGLPIARALYDRGFSVVMFDFRGQGASPGGPVTYGAREQLDVAGAVTYARQRGAGSVGVMGFSAGAVAAILAAAADEQIAAVVADSAYADLHEYLTGLAQARSGLGGVYPEYAVQVFRLVTGADERTVSPRAVVGALAPRPLLIIHGGRDRVIPPDHAGALLAAAGNPRAELWIVPEGRHTHSYEVDPAQYLARVVGFLEQSMTRP